MKSLRYCTAVLALTVGGLAAGAAPASAQVEPLPGEGTFTIFLRGTDIGREQVNLTRAGSQWIITSTGRLGDVTLNRFELKYASDWQPVELRVETSQAGKSPKTTVLLTSFAMTTAINEITLNGVTNSKTDQISARTVVLPGNVFGGYEALAARLANSSVGTELSTYVPTRSEVKVHGQGHRRRINHYASGNRANAQVRAPRARSELDVHDDGLASTTGTGSHASTCHQQTSASSAAISPASRRARLTARNPSDSDVTIPANGFSIAGTMTSPPVMGRLRHPTVVLVAGAGPIDRDGMVAGIPILSQLAGALAEQGYLVVRYDKRAVGQSGGRSETVTQADYADDLVAIVKWLAKRDDVDDRRIAVAGHGEGAMIAMLAAEREKKIGSLVLMSASGSTGADLILEQQRRAAGSDEAAGGGAAQKIDAAEANAERRDQR